MENWKWKIFIILSGIIIIGGAFTTIAGLLTGANIKELIKATKAQKQTAKAVKDFVNNKDFMDIINRYLRMNGKKEVTSEQLLEAYNKVDKAKVMKEVLKG